MSKRDDLRRAHIAREVHDAVQREAHCAETIVHSPESLAKVVAAARKDERAKLIATVAHFEGFLSHHHDAKAAREHNVRQVHALVERLRAEGGAK